MLSRISLFSASFCSLAFAGQVIWDGRFNDLSSSADLNKWSWASQVGPYQYYIHGKGAVDKYVNLSPTFKNPSDTTSKQGVKITIDPTANWNSQMWRTELIPSTKAAINKGKVYYHFSMKMGDKNKPSVNHEHQVNFFESHFVEMKYGLISGSSDTEAAKKLQFVVGGKSMKPFDFTPDVWLNFAYEIDFAGGSVSLWSSQGSEPLKLTSGPHKASTNSNGADWHLGVLRLPKEGSSAPEDWYFSGVYIEQGPITTSVKGA